MAIQRTVGDIDETKFLERGALRKEGTEVFASLRPTKVRPALDDLIIIANEGDRMDALAFKFYGSPSLWFVIASVNNLVNGVMHIPPGTQLRIPSKNRVV